MARWWSGEEEVKVELSMRATTEPYQTLRKRERESHRR